MEFAVQYDPNIADMDSVAWTERPTERLNSIMDSTVSAKQNFPLISEISFVLQARKPERAFRKGGFVHPDVALCRRERRMAEHL